MIYIWTTNYIILFVISFLFRLILQQTSSTLTFEGIRFTGPAEIIGKFLTLGTLMHDIPRLSVDVQMGTSEAHLIIFVVGQMSIQGENPLNFSQVFQLVSSYLLLNCT